MWAVGAGFPKRAEPGPEAPRGAQWPGAHAGGARGSDPRAHWSKPRARALVETGTANRRGGAAFAIQAAHAPAITVPPECGVYPFRSTQAIPPTCINNTVLEPDIDVRLEVALQ